MSAVRDTILNNYLSTYGSTITRYDSHKKSELRSTYNSIVKMNKESPWFLPVTSKDTQQFAVSLKENARELRSSIAELGGLEEDGLLNKKSAFSSNTEVVTAKYIGEDADSNSVPSFDIEVRNLASGQENSGYYLPDRNVGLAEDTYSFDVSINDMNYEFQFSISEGESNKDVQSRLARLINNAGIGLKASVDEADNHTSLKIESEATGSYNNRDYIFEISDNRTSKTSGAVAYFGIDYVAQQPENANFLINGEEKSASSNHFTVGKLYEVNLTGTSPDGESTSVGLKTDMESVADNVTGLIGSYNNFLRSVNTYLETQSKSKLLKNELGNIASYYSTSLSSIGVHMEEDGTLSVNRAEVQEAAENSENLTSTFSALKDFSNSLLRKSSQISLNPMNYVQRTVVAYKNPGHNFASPYTTSEYSGMMFNFFC